jgi:hypothetical protein
MILDLFPGVTLRFTPGWQRGGPTDLMQNLGLQNLGQAHNKIPPSLVATALYALYRSMPPKSVPRSQAMGWYAAEMARQFFNLRCAVNHNREPCQKKAAG